MDLISREALVNDLCEDLEEGTFEFTDSQAEAADKIIVYVTKRINAQPSIPAVPLDKLCEWLAEHYEPLYSMADIYKLKMPIDFNQQKEIWRAAIIRWMEEQDEVD